MSPAFNHAFSAGELTITFMIFIPFGFSLMTAQIHSKSPLRASSNSVVSFCVRYVLCLSPKLLTIDFNIASSISIFDFLSNQYE
jgi:hypothetical protein